MKKKAILVIRDGWGYREKRDKNAIAIAKTPFNDYLIENYPSTTLSSSGRAVGLPEGYQGNSEVGHLTIGAGRIIYQSLERINKSITDKTFFKKKVFLDAIRSCKKNKKTLHLVGLLQEEGVHSHINHLLALISLCKKEGFKDLSLHLFTDGRDSPVQKGKNLIKKIEEDIKKENFGKIMTICGRYYSMDRDNRWQRTKKAYEAIMEGKSQYRFKDALRGVKDCYKKGETDEFILPRVKEGYKGVEENDSIIFFNFRTDRPRQLIQAMTEKNFNNFKRKFVKSFFVAMTNYYDGINAKVAFKEEEIKDTLSEVISRNNLKQLKITETEKYAHVTFFLNGQKEVAVKNEKRIMIPSPKVATYDKKPKMSVAKIEKTLCDEIKKGIYDFIVVNLVNCDMVGHSGKERAIVEAVEAVDKATKKIVNCGLKYRYSSFIFADHGNAEDQRKEWRTSHTINPVPFIFVPGKKENTKTIKMNKKAGLKNITPTILSYFDIKIPSSMEKEQIYNIS